jgi:hypothetical protein
MIEHAITGSVIVKKKKIKYKTPFEVKAVKAAMQEFKKIEKQHVALHSVVQQMLKPFNQGMGDYVCENINIHVDWTNDNETILIVKQGIDNKEYCIRISNYDYESVFVEMIILQIFNGTYIFDEDDAQD